MSTIPDGNQLFFNYPAEAPQDQPAPAESPSKPSRFLKWHRRVLGFCLFLFALEIGLFLLVFPWRPEWEMSWIPVHSPKSVEVWMSPYFRGALSGLGLLNLYVAVSELVKQVKSLFGAGQRR